jgi:hypothetical protein
VKLNIGKDGRVTVEPIASEPAEEQRLRREVAEDRYDAKSEEERELEAAQLRAVMISTIANTRNPGEGLLALCQAITIFCFATGTDLDDTLDGIRECAKEINRRDCAEIFRGAVAEGFEMRRVARDAARKGGAS